MDRPLAASYLLHQIDAALLTGAKTHKLLMSCFQASAVRYGRATCSQYWLRLLSSEAEQPCNIMSPGWELLTHIPFTSFCPPASYTSPDLHPSFDKGPCVLLIHFGGPTGTRTGTGPFIKSKLNSSKRLMAPQACKMQRQMF